MGRKSTAQPRPAVHVPPKGIGPIEEPNPNDVLCGRGGRINSHEGNIQFRNIVNTRKKDYLSKNTKKLEKAHIAAGIVEQIRTMNPPGRFLKEDSGDGFWYDIGDAKAIKKVGQALREDAPGIRDEIDGEESSGDEKKPAPAAAGPTGVATTGTAAVVSPGPGFISGQVAVHGHHQQPVAWNNAGAPVEQAPPFPQYPPTQGAYNAPDAFPTAPSPTMSYKVPDQFYNQGGLPTKTGALSSTAREVMKMSGTPTSGAGGTQVAFGREFTPTEMSLGSGGTISTISGMSGISGAYSSGVRTSNLSGSDRNPSLRLSQLSDLSFRAGSSYGLSRSFSVPELGISALEGDDSMNALLAEEKAVLEAYEGQVPVAPLAAPSRGLSAGKASSSSGSGRSSGSSGRQATMRIRDPHPLQEPLRGRTQSGASGISAASGGSQRSRLSSIMSIGSDSSWMHPLLMSRLSEISGSGASGSSQMNLGGDEQSVRSAMSEMSYDFVALDLAGV